MFYLEDVDESVVKTPRLEEVIIDGHSVSIDHSYVQRAGGE